MSAPPARHVYPPPWEALGDLLHLGGREGFVPPPRAGTRAAWPQGEGALLALLVACVRSDAAEARARLAAVAGEPALTREAAWTRERWWAGAAGFLSARLGVLGLGDAVPAGLRAPLLAEERVCRRRHEHAEVIVRTVIERLERDGLRPILVKGLSFSHWLYDEPWARPAGDVDVLLSPDEARRAERRLLDDGWVAAPMHAGPGGRVHRHHPPLVRRADGLPWVLELHTALADRASPERMGDQELYARSTTMRLGTCSVRVLQDDDRLAHLALHHPAELTCRRTLDVLLAARRLGAAGFKRARRLLDGDDRWQLDLLALLAACLIDPGLAAAVPLRRRAALAVACAPDWPRAHLAALRAGRPAAGHAGLVRRPLRAAGDRLHQLGWAALPVLAREPRRRALALARLLRDLARAAAGRRLSP